MATNYEAVRPADVSSSHPHASPGVAHASASTSDTGFNKAYADATSHNKSNVDVPTLDIIEGHTSTAIQDDMQRKMPLIAKDLELQAAASPNANPNKPVHFTQAEILGAEGVTSVLANGNYHPSETADIMSYRFNAMLDQSKNKENSKPEEQVDVSKVVQLVNAYAGTGLKFVPEAAVPDANGQTAKSTSLIQLSQGEQKDFERHSIDPYTASQSWNMETAALSPDGPGTTSQHVAQPLTVTGRGFDNYIGATPRRGGITFSGSHSESVNAAITAASINERQKFEMNDPWTQSQLAQLHPTPTSQTSPTHE